MATATREGAPSQLAGEWIMDWESVFRGYVLKCALNSSCWGEPRSEGCIRRRSEPNRQ
jgi:hypothetical protein